MFISFSINAVLGTDLFLLVAFHYIALVGMFISFSINAVLGTDLFLLVAFHYIALVGNYCLFFIVVNKISIYLSVYLMPQALQSGVPSSASLHSGVLLALHDAHVLPPPPLPAAAAAAAAADAAR